MELTRRQYVTKNLAWVGFYSLILLAWIAMFAMTSDMGLDIFGRGKFVDFVELCLTPAGPLNMASFLTFYSMWGLMMAAMMLPTFVPSLRSFEDMIGAGAAKRNGFVGLIFGYLVVWLGFAALFALAQSFMQMQGWLNVLGASASGWLTFVLLLIAGLYQFTASKDACLTKCRSPMTYFIGHWKAGPLGGALMGADLGIYCVGCCWAMMSLGFVGGVMNLVWMGVATLIMTMEKLPDIGRKLTRPLGIAFLLAALLVGVSNLSLF